MITPILAAVSLCLPATPVQEGVLIDVDHRGLEALLVDDKDAGLRRALRMAPVRIAELVSVMDDPDFPPKAVFLLARLVDGRTRFTFGNNPDPDASFPFLARLALIEKDAEAAAELGLGVHTFFQETGAPTAAAADAEGWYRLELNPPGWYGVRGNEVELHLGERTDGRPPLGAGMLPDGAHVAFALEADLAGLVASVGGFAELQLPVLLKGVLDGRLSYALGSDAERMYENLTYREAAREMVELGLLGRAPLGERDLRLLPRDTTWGGLAAVEPKVLFELFAELLADEGVDLQAEVERELGLDLRGLVSALGGTAGVFASDTTGGGGWLSAVAFVRVADPEAVEAATARLIAAANEQLAERTDGYVQVRSWMHAEHEYHALTFPGLPVPFEPTWTIHAGVLYLAATPQAAVAAVLHAASGTTSVLDHPGLLAQLPGGRADLEGAYSLGFLDSPRMLQSGYGVASLAMSALVNGTRSRSDSPVGRDAGVILPPFGELAAGARCWVEWTRVRGDDVVVHATADRSMSVNLAAFLGLFGEPVLAMAVPGVLAWTTGRQIASRLEMAQDAVVRADLLTLEQAVVLYTIANGGQFPDSLEDLVRPDAGGKTYLDRTDVPRDPWGHPYVYFPPRGQERFRLLSRGADGAPGGEGENRDITLEEAKRR